MYTYDFSYLRHTTYGFIDTFSTEHLVAVLGQMRERLLVNFSYISISLSVLSPTVLSKICTFVGNAYKFGTWFIHGLSTIVRCCPLLSTLQSANEGFFISFLKEGGYGA